MVVTSPRHPARCLEFRNLHEALISEVEAGRVVRKIETLTGLHMFTYSKSCVYEKAWNETNMLARGLILHPESESVVATPFPKFFNYGEMDHHAPLDMHFEAHQKMDGSLIICFFWSGQWRFVTKGSFSSDQAQWAQKWAHENLPLDVLEVGYTYLFEAIYPENKIVVKYPFSSLVLLGLYTDLGYECAPWSLVEMVARALGVPIAQREPRCTLNELAERAKALPADFEGWVLRFDNGYRLKIKGAEYLRLHRMLANMTPLAIWDLMRSKSDLITYRAELPEEFLADFDSIYMLLSKQIDRIVHDTKTWLDSLIWSPAKGYTLTDKDVGLALHKAPEHVRRFVFPYRNSRGKLLQDDRSREALYRAIRPTNNRLEGYVPSTSTQRVLDEIQSL